MPDGDLNKLLGKAARFCTIRERSAKEVEAKLIKWQVDEKQIATIISKLKKEGFLDEEICISSLYTSFSTCKEC